MESVVSITQIFAENVSRFDILEALKHKLNLAYISDLRLRTDIIPMLTRAVSVISERDCPLDQWEILYNYLFEENPPFIDAADAKESVLRRLAEKTVF